MRVARLSEVCEVVMGQAPPGESYNSRGEGVPLLAGAGDFGIVNPEPNRFTTNPSRLSEIGDILLCVRATIGERNWSDRTYCVGRGVAALRAKSPDLDMQYLWHWLATAKPVLEHSGRGSTFKQVTRDAVESLSLPLPPLAEQRRIAAILDKADAIRRKRRESIELLEEFLRSVFLEMFGDPVRNEKGWEVVELGDHLTFLTSGSRGWAKYYSPSGSRFVRSLDVQMNRISDTDAVFVRPPSGAEAERTRVLTGDVLLTITGSRIGRVAPVERLQGNAHVSQHVAILRLANTICPHYLSMFLSQARGGQHQIRQAQYGQTKPGLSLNHIRSFQVPLPPLDAQRGFLRIVNTVRRMEGCYMESSGRSRTSSTRLRSRRFGGSCERERRASRHLLPRR